MILLGQATHIYMIRWTPEKNIHETEHYHYQTAAGVKKMYVKHLLNLFRLNQNTAVKVYNDIGTEKLRRLTYDR